MSPSLSPKRSHPETSARFTRAPSRYGRDVVGCEGVAALAVSLPRVLCARASAAQDVLGHRRNLHVRRVDASWVVAEVVKGEAIRNLPDQLLVSIPVSCVSIFQRGGEAPVSTVLRPGPLPAITGLVDPGPEPLAFGWKLDLRGHRPSETPRHLVMHLAQASDARLSVAVGDRANTRHDIRSAPAVVTCQAGGCA